MTRSRLVEDGFGKDRRGGVVILFALSAMVLAVATAMVMNQVSFYTDKRRLQASVDMAALMLMQSGEVTNARATQMVKAQLPTMQGLVVTVTKGRYSPDATKASEARFVANASPWNAIEVNASINGDKVMAAGMMPGNVNISARARAARRQTTTFSVGSRLVRLEGGLSQALLDATLGYNGKLTVMDYNLLAAANIDAVQLLKSLNTQLNLNCATFEDVLNSGVKVGDLAKAMAASTGSSAVKTLLNAANPLNPGDRIKLASLLDLGSIKALPLEGVMAGQTIPINVGELLVASAALSNGDDQVTVNLAKVLGDPSIANASLSIGDKQQLMRFSSYAEVGHEVDTAQLSLKIGALGLVAVDVSLASAEVAVDEIACKSDGSAAVTLKAKTEAASVGVKAPLLPKLSIKAGSDETKKVTFTQAEINAQTMKPVRSGLGLQVGPLSIAQKLLFQPVDDLLEAVGLHVAEADIKVIEASCGKPGLVN